MVQMPSSEWNLDDQAIYTRAFKFELPFAVTWGYDDLAKRERIRAAAQPHFAKSTHPVAWWAFRITCTKAKPRGVDADNFVKLIIDSFAGKQLRKDQSRFPALELFPDDDIPNVQLVQIRARPGLRDSTFVEIFARRS